VKRLLLSINHAFDSDSLAFMALSDLLVIKYKIRFSADPHTVLTLLHHDDALHGLGRLALACFAVSASRFGI
jgi:hypothetical protein